MLIFYKEDFKMLYLVTMVTEYCVLCVQITSKLARFGGCGIC